jgi:hypothetical protein
MRYPTRRTGAIRQTLGENRKQHAEVGFKRKGRVQDARINSSIASDSGGATLAIA